MAIIILFSKTPCLSLINFISGVMHINTYPWRCQRYFLGLEQLIISRKCPWMQTHSKWWEKVSWMCTMLCISSRFSNDLLGYILLAEWASASSSDCFIQREMSSPAEDGVNSVLQRKRLEKGRRWWRKSFQNEFRTQSPFKVN